MSLQNIHLRKLLKIMYLDGAPRVSALRADIRDEIAREIDVPSNGGDFYGPFWRDAKDHVFGVNDLHDQTRIRIASNPGRENLYSRLRDGFLLWWNERRRWTNEPFNQAPSIKRAMRLPGVEAEIKFANILSVRDANNDEHFVYPYWFPTPTMTDEMARLALWALCEAFPQIDRNELRVLDVIRGQTFGLDRNPLQGNEPDIFGERHAAALRQWRQLRTEYE